MTEMMMGKWYDPISQRWIEPRQARPVTAWSPSSAETVPDPSRTAEARRIWNLLVDCCGG